MTGPTNAIAQAMATAVQPHFARHLSSAAAAKYTLAALPSVEEIAAMVEAAFWGSLRRQEGFVTRISLALLAPEQSTAPVRLERPLPLTPGTLTRLAPAVERPRIHLGVWRTEERLIVWGVTRVLPDYCFVLEVSAPGILVLKHSPGGDSGKFVNVAVIEGDRVKIIAQPLNDTDGHTGLPISVVLPGLSPPRRLSADLPVEIAMSMRTHGRGGALLVVPSQHESWRESILQPIRYSVSPPFRELAGLLHSAAINATSIESALLGTVDFIAGLTALDGATVVSDEYELLAFGAKIRRREGCPVVENVLVAEPVEGAELEVCHPEELGGMRHVSASQFVHDQRNAIALVASQQCHCTGCLSGRPLHFL